MFVDTSLMINRNRTECWIILHFHFIIKVVDAYLLLHCAQTIDLYVIPMFACGYILIFGLDTSYLCWYFLQMSYSRRSRYVLCLPICVSFSLAVMCKQNILQNLTKCITSVHSLQIGVRGPPHWQCMACMLPPIYL